MQPAQASYKEAEAIRNIVDGIDIAAEKTAERAASAESAASPRVLQLGTLSDLEDAVASATNLIQFKQI